jgi:hypothetical protein
MIATSSLPSYQRQQILDGVILLLHKLEFLEMLSNKITKRNSFQNRIVQLF